jgi:hypothetical protein
LRRVSCTPHRHTWVLRGMRAGGVTPDPPPSFWVNSPHDWSGTFRPLQSLCSNPPLHFLRSLFQFTISATLLCPATTVHKEGTQICERIPRSRQAKYKSPHANFAADCNDPSLFGSSSVASNPTVRMYRTVASRSNTPPPSIILMLAVWFCSKELPDAGPFIAFRILVAESVVLPSMVNDLLPIVVMHPWPGCWLLYAARV